MHDTSTHLLLLRADRAEDQARAAARRRAVRVAHLRRLDRRAERAATSAHLIRLALG